MRKNVLKAVQSAIIHKLVKNVKMATIKTKKIIALNVALNVRLAQIQDIVILA